MRRRHHGVAGLGRRGVGSASILSVLRRIGTLRIRPVAGSFTTRPFFGRGCWLGGFEALLQPTAKVDEPKTASKGKRKAHGEGPRYEPIHGESYDAYADGVRRSVRNRSGGASSSADWSAAPKARSG